MRLGAFYAVVVVVALGVGVERARGQVEPMLGAMAGGPGTINGTATATLKKQPDAMRITMQVVASGKTLKEAMADLKSRQATLKAKLVALGANEKSIQWEGTAIGEVKDNRQRQIEMMVRQRMAASGKKAAAKDEAKPATVSSTVRADWALKADSPEDALLAGQELQDKVKALKAVAATSEPAKPTAEQEEAQEEAMNMMGGEEEQPKPGEPVLLYVAHIAATERTKLMSDAFQKARGQAVDTAAAAGATIGPLRSLTGSTGPDQRNMQDPSYWQNPMFRNIMGQVNAEAAEGGDEAVSANAGSVGFQAQVMASFGLVEKGGK